MDHPVKEELMDDELYEYDEANNIEIKYNAINFKTEHQHEDTVERKEIEGDSKHERKCNKLDRKYSVNYTSDQENHNQNNNNKTEIHVVFIKQNQAKESKMKSKNKGTPIECDICKKQLPSKQDLYIFHRKTHTRESTYRCLICFKTFESKILLKRNLVNHVVTKNQKEKRNQCHICNKIFSSSFNYKRHKLTHVSDNAKSKFGHECKICQKYFSQKAVLVRHELIHTEKKQYKCGTCKKVFRQKASLTRHKISHSKKKPYKCKICKKRFRCRYSRRVHRLTHFEEKNYDCDLCGQRFYTRALVNVHKRIKHDKYKTGHKFKCKLCNKTFVCARGLSIHSKSALTHKHYYCLICSTTFLHKTLLRDHFSKGCFPVKKQPKSAEYNYLR